MDTCDPTELACHWHAALSWLPWQLPDDASLLRTQEYFRFYLTAVAFIVVFGGLLAPIAEVKLGIGGGHRSVFAL